MQRHTGIRGIQINDAIQPETAQIREPQRDVPCDVAERVASLVTVRGGIRQFAAADAIENDQENAREWSQAGGVER